MEIDKATVEVVKKLIDLEEKQSLANWWRADWGKQCYREIADEAIANLTEPTLHGNGRGIVTAGGGNRYFPSLWVLINRLRDVGCGLPIECWYLGEAEFDPIMRKLLQPLGVELIDAYRLREKRPFRILNGWELKAYALLHTAFKEPLFLDADNAPVRNPAYLFDTPQYLNSGTVFWPDFPHWMLRKPQYEVFGCSPPVNMEPPDHDIKMGFKPIQKDAGYDVPVESGQILLDRSKCWKPLLLAAHFCEHSDYYFRHVHGDKECFHLAWRRLEEKYAMPMFWPGWDSHTCLQHDFDGNLIFAHRNDFKWTLGENARTLGQVPYEMDCMRLVEKLRSLWYGEAWVNTAPSTEELALTMELTGKRFYYHRKDIDVRILELAPGGTIGKGNADCEKKWSVWIVDGEPILSITGRHAIGGYRDKQPRPTVNLRRRKDGTWRGKWFMGEKADTIMRPIDDDSFDEEVVA